jgi:hypothetical protein
MRQPMSACESEASVRFWRKPAIPPASQFLFLPKLHFNLPHRPIRPTY